MDSDESSEEEESETVNMVDEQEQNLTTIVQCSDGSQSESKSVPPRKLLVVSLRGDANIEQTHTDTRIREIQRRQQITDENWNIFKETDAVKAIKEHFNNEQIIKRAIVEFVLEKGHLQFKARDLMSKIPEDDWN